ncbi:Tetratricopeptide repeat-containing protein [Lentzea waywayandensis]|uniref:Tetratricopeptide repeat-containing protein n=1 Tax=Lentzea waywayandensis TaxID=84724 RepID=A0A1I6CT43_9PSEU|nr:helix-turn-helix domain-containing protein [Lentzea waywayandensis]SFQ96272.1 Tetratricopeptide repeat-containing protein [Lentzea waywayandensis]
MDGSFGALLRHHRLAAALTQEALAEQAGISAQAIGALERGARRYPHRETVTRLARALRLNPEQQSGLVTAASRPSVPRADLEPSGQVVAAQLPASVQGFTGREGVLLTMDALLAHESNAVVVSAIAGMAGIGKTTLAVHWAHRARSRFPDGQLFLNLRGHGGGAPVTPLEALTHLLVGLGLERAKVPADAETAAATYRTLLADRRVLVVLDDAVDARQVRPLLPGSPGCLVLVTSRYRLDGLVARDGARRIQLEQLSPDAARSLLVHVLGEQRIAAEPDAVTDLVGLCAGLPLALRIAAAHLLGGRTIGGYVAALRSGDRLASLAAPGDPDTAVGAAFDLSYQALEPAARRVFRLMGHMPGRDLTADAIAALTALDPAETERCLRLLTAAHLVDEHRPGRYTFHDLLRLHAAHLVDTEREAATERLWGHFALTLLNAGERVDPRTYRHVLAEDYRHTTFIDDIIANTWIDVETENLVATTHAAAKAGHTRLAVQLLIALHPQFERHRMEVVWLGTGTAVLEAARRSGDLLAEAHALRIIGDAQWCGCDYEQSLIFLGKALTAAEELGHKEFYRVVLCALGRTSISMGRPRDCADYYRRARELWRQDGRPTDGALVLGDAYWELGELDSAYELHTETIAVSRDKGVRYGVLLGETHAGRSCQALGRLERAIEHYEAGLALCREFAEPAEEAGNLANLSGAYRDLEKYDLALDTAREALEIATRLGMRRTQISAWHVLGSTHLLLGYDDAARTELRTALDLAVATSHQRGRCDALISLAALHLRHEEHDSARASAQEALEISRGTGHRLIEGESLRVLAEVDLALGRVDDARRRAEEAGTLHARSGYRLGAQRVADVLRRIT